MRNAELRFAESSANQGANRRRPEHGSGQDRPAQPVLDGTGAPALRALITIFGLLVVALLAFGASRASAELKHVNPATAEYGTDGTVSGPPFSANFPDLVYQTNNHRIYLYKESDPRLYAFTTHAPGVNWTPEAAPWPLSSPDIGGSGPNIAAAVDNTAGPTSNRVYIAPDEPHFLAYSPGGSQIGEFATAGSVCGAAVDNAGNVWLGNLEDSKVEEYSPAGAELFSFSTAAIGGACRVLVDQINDDVYAATYGGAMYKFTAASDYTEFKEVAPGGERFGLNSVKHKLYAENPNNLYAYDTETGKRLEEFGEGTSWRGITVDESNDTVYVFSTATSRIAEFAPAVVPKTVTGEPVGNKKVSGTVSPDGAGNITECFFEWGEFEGYGEAPVPCEPGTLPYTAEQAVTATLPLPTNEQTYHYRVVAKTASQTNRGADETITPHNVAGLRTEAATEVNRDGAKLNGSYDGNGEETKFHFEYGTDTSYGTSSPETVVPGNPNSHTALEFTASGLDAGTTYHFRVVAKNGIGESLGNDRTFTTPPAASNVHTGTATELTPTSAKLGGDFDIDALGGDTHYWFEFGLTDSYGAFAPATVPPGADAGSIVGHPVVSQAAETLAGNVYHFRIAVENVFGIAYGEDATFESPQPPAISSITSANVTATTAEVLAQINPQNAETTYQFEYGTSTAYDHTVPLSPKAIGSGNTPVAVNEALTELVAGATYHFRVVATNVWGTTASPDQTFEFFTPNCPNSHLRQQTGSAYLPDCRAYELVSPGNAGPIQIFPGLGIGPIVQAFLPIPPTSNTGLASSPARVTFWAGIGQLPGANPPNILQDMYVSTRTTDGWETHFTGVPGNEALSAGGIECESSMARCIGYHFKDPLGTNEFDIGSAAPYVFDSSEDSVIKGRFPTDVEAVEEGEEFNGAGLPSKDFSHFAFGSSNIIFAAGGVEGAPGSVYDNDTAANTVTTVSEAAGGGSIKQDPKGCTTETSKERECANEVLGVQAVSSDGSHILISNWAEPASGEFKAGGPEATTFTTLDLHLTMHVAGAGSFDVTRGHRGDFVGMSPDGSKVYFTSDEKVTADDHDNSVDLFMWSRTGGGDSVVRVSAGSGAGDTDSCTTTWTEGCDVEVASGAIETEAPEESILTGDNWISRTSGDILFYSPEQLTGTDGFAGRRNLYEFHEGQLRFVTSLPGAFPAVRMQVTPDGGRVAILTKAKLTGYDNTAHYEMYTVDPGQDPPAVTCVSCNPTGTPASGEVKASGNGLFMSDDGRTFFSTSEALVPFDTDGIRDVYEYVAGRPQMISSGTAQQDTWGGGLLFYPEMTVGLEGVSADGVDVYFTTFETLVPQDENGEFIKIYDARTGGGFPADEPIPPCKAADECHGVGSVTPGAPQIGTAAKLGVTGNHPNQKKKNKKKNKKKAKKHGKHKRHQTGRAGR